MNQAGPPPTFRQEDGPTPEFVSWSLTRRCPLRAEQTELSPAATARWLKPVAALDHCLRGGWGVELSATELVCLDPRSAATGGEWRGCRVAEVLAYYGGAARCDATCHACPANIRRQALEDYPPLPSTAAAPRWAGCFGWLRGDPALLAVIEHSLPRGGDSAWFSRFGLVPTRPAWYGLWTQPTVRGAWLPELLRLWSMVSGTPGLGAAVQAEVRDFQAALAAAATAGLELAVDLLPAGATCGTTWTIAPHCPTCKRTWTGSPDTAAACPACGQPGRPHPPRRRKRIGYRPFLQLRNVLAAEQWAQLARRAEAQARCHHNQPALPRSTVDTPSAESL